jgi:hypothetical protein
MLPACGHFVGSQSQRPCGHHFCFKHWIPCIIKPFFDKGWHAYILYLFEVFFMSKGQSNQINV